MKKENFYQYFNGKYDAHYNQKNLYTFLEIKHNQLENDKAIN